MQRATHGGETMTRQEILIEAQRQAESYLLLGDIPQAYAAYTIELKNHKETENHLGITLGFQMLMAGLIADVPAMRKHLQGFN